MFKSHISNSALSMISLFNLMRKDVTGRGMRGFNTDLFVCFGLVGMFGKVGCSCLAVHKLFYSNSVNGVAYESTRDRLSSLIGLGFVVKRRQANKVYYSISSHAEKLIVKSLGRDELRGIARLVKDSMS